MITCPHSDDDKYRYCMVGYQLKTHLCYRKMVLLPAAYAPQMLIQSDPVLLSIHRLNSTKAASDLLKIKVKPGMRSMEIPSYP